MKTAEEMEICYLSHKQGFIHFLETLLRFTWHYEERVFSDDLQNIATLH